MPPLFVPHYSYDDDTLTPPTPGKDLILAVGLVLSRLGVGPKGGGGYAGIPLSVGSTTTSFRRHDGVEMRLPNSDLVLWSAPFDSAARKLGINILAERPGWEWLRWTLADHVAADYERLAPDLDVVPIHPPTGDAGPLVVVPCGSRKRDYPAPAKDLYISSYQQLCLRAAYALTAPANIRILSYAGSDFVRATFPRWTAEMRGHLGGVCSSLAEGFHSRSIASRMRRVGRMIWTSG